LLSRHILRKQAFIIQFERMPDKMIKFLEANQIARAKEKEIPDALWERHKEYILRKHQAGNSFEKISAWFRTCVREKDFQPKYAVHCFS
jgi:hypothetical protein